MFTHLYRQSISCVLSTVLLSNMLYASDIAVDSVASVQHQANLDATANGVPLVNIVTSNAAGLSHNKFSDFNVNPVGLILNNATGIVPTQLGGFVQGNANLGTTPARVILNEVTGTSRTLLRGYTEVAGHPADVIIANPNGITVNGGGFINTPRATLTTGTPDYTSGVYQGFKVREGDILIQGDGMVSDNIDRVDLYTKTLQLNAKIYAKRLDVITGDTNIAQDGSHTTLNGIGIQPYSIDSSTLGGIYANAIILVATDAGVGVNLPQITYASDSLHLSADGHIVIGTAIAENTLTSTSKSLTVNDKAYATDVTLHADQTLTNNGAVIADTLHITGGDIINNAGIIGETLLGIDAVNITNNDVLYSANSIDLSASNVLLNTNTIRSEGDISIHDTGTVLNEAARIEATRDMSIQATAVENLSSMTPTKSNVTISIGNTVYWADYRDHKTTITSTETINKSLYTPAYLLAGNDMAIDAAIHNRYSLIASDRDLYLSGSLTNEVALNAHQIIDISHYVQRWETHSDFWSSWSGWYHNYSYYEHYNTIIDHVYSTISAGRNLLGTLATVNNADITQDSTNTNFSSAGIPSSSVFSNLTFNGSTYTLPGGKYGDFITVNNPALPYLIESNPLYTNYNTFISSDYIMSRLNLNMASDTKRLGDARYETNLVRDAVFRLTGERRLAGFGTDTEQYQALMDNAISVADDLHLALGVSLSSSQLASLDRDIVWMEEKIIAGQKVLVPQLYLTSLKNSTLSEGGKIVAGNDMQLAVAGELNNAGAIRAGGTVVAAADTITNTTGSIKSTGDMLLHASGDITNTSAKISANNVALLSDTGNITSQTAHKQIDLSSNAGTTGHLDTVGQRTGMWAQGNLVTQAAKDINLIGSETAAGANLALRAENITIASLEQASNYKTTWNQASSEIESIKQHASTLNATGDVTLNSTKDITVNSSTIAAGNNLALNAGENVNITADNNREFMDVKTSNKSFLSSSSKRDMTLKESVAASAITGENITINSGGDTTLQAANLIAAQNIQVDATGNINVLAKTYREASLHEESKSSLGGLKNSMSLDSSDAVKLHEATVTTQAQNIILNSGKDINIVASEINAAADLQLKAFENLNIVAGQESSSVQHVSKKSSFNPLGLISLVDPLMGTVIKPTAYTQETHTKNNYDTTAKSSSISAGGNINTQTGTTNIIGSNLAAQGDVNIKADIGGINVASAQELHNASSLDKKTEIKLADVLTSTVGAVQGLSNDTKLKFNVATAQFDEATTTSQGVTNKASSITSGKNVTLDSSDDLTIKGSDVTAADTIDLKSKTGNIAITESVDTTNTQSKEKHAKADVSLVVQNEFVETAVAVNAALQSAKQLKKVKEDYSNYKRQLKGLEVTLDTLRTDPQVSEKDISNLQSLIALTKDDETYYIAAIAAATVDLASKTVIVAQQVEAARNSTATYGFSAGIQLDLKGSKSTTDTTATKSNASNLNGKNITIATDNTKETSTTISGSNVNAADTLNIDTRDLNILASTDTTNSNSDSKDISGSVSMTVYGASTGPQVSMGYGQNSSRSNSTTHTNSTLTANTVNLNATNDATFKGATVRADDTLNVNVANNLIVESVQDTASSSNHGFNISSGFGMGSDTTHANTDVGLRTGNGKVESVNGGIGVSNGRSYDTQTVLTSLTGNTVNVTTGANTKLTGALVAATDENGNDTGKLNLSTGTLTTENLTDTHYNSQSGFSIGANVGLTPETKDPKPNTQNKEDKTSTTINSPRLAFNTSKEVAVGKTLATLGQGSVTITDTANSSDTTNLNRDVTKVDKELYSSSTGTKVDATLDTRMLTKEGRAQINQQYKDMDKNMKAVADTLPNATSDNKIEAIAGTIWDNITGFTGGILPSNANSGGLLGQVSGLTGNKDSLKEVFQVVSSNSPRYNEEQESFMKIENSEAYKRMDEDKQKQVAGLYISINPVSINKDKATYQNPINGMMNDKAAAISNGFEQTGMLANYNKDKNAIVELTQFYNPTRGIIADGLESLVDKLGGTTGIAKQTGEHIRDVTTARGIDGSNFPLHSQANLIAYNGIEYVQSTDNKFQTADKFKSTVPNASGGYDGTPTFVSFGSPKNWKDMKDLIANEETGLGYTYMGAFTKPGDGVGELLGANKGANEGSVSPLYRFNPAVIVGEGLLLFSPWSPHSSYDPNNYPQELKDVRGYRK
jgi:filamentous hemagglutinin